MRILIAEDDLTSRALLENTLIGWGHEVVTTQDGDEAYKVLKEDFPPVIAVLDWMMPGMDGVDICRKIRAEHSDSPIYIILLTAKDSKQDIANGLEAGADDYVTKPFNRSELRARIQAGVRITQLQLDLRRNLKELKEYQAQLIQSARLASLGSLANGIAHEINNPLFAISGRAQLLMSDTEKYLAAPKATEYLNDIKEMSDRISRITTHLVQYSQSSTEMVELDLSEMLDSAMTLVGKKISKVHIEREYHRSPHIKGVPAQLQQVFVSLLMNALEALEDGGNITLTSTVESSDGVVYIKDNGCGIPQEVMDRLFEPFVTTKSKGERLVMGIGLYAVHNIVKAHLGNISVESEPGKGTSVRLEFPLIEELVMGD